MGWGALTHLFPSFHGGLQMKESEQWDSGVQGNRNGSERTDKGAASIVKGESQHKPSVWNRAKC